MNPIDLLTKKDLMASPRFVDGRNVGGYSMTAAFIRRYGREMGGRGKPMRWVRELVELFIVRHYEVDRLRREFSGSITAVHASTADRVLSGLIEGHAKPSAQVVPIHGRRRAVQVVPVGV